MRMAMVMFDFVCCLKLIVPNPATYYRKATTLFQLVEKAISSQASTTDATQRAARFQEKYLRRLKELHKYPW